MPVRPFSLPEFTLYFLDEGAGDDVAVFLHGFPMSHKLWEEFIKELSPNMRCLAPDMRGFGQSAMLPIDTLSLEILADDIAKMLDALDVSQAHIIGASMGAMVAMTFAARHGRLTKSLVVLHSEADVDDDAAKANRDTQIAVVHEHGAKAFAHSFARKALGTHVSDDLCDRLAGIMAENNAESMIAGLKLLRDRPDLKPILPGITAPTLVVAGEKDENSPPELMQKTADLFSNGHFIIIPDCGHISVLEQPEMLRDLLMNWVKGQR